MRSQSALLPCIRAPAVLVGEFHLIQSTHLLLSFHFFLCLRVDIWIFRKYARLAETCSIVFDKLPRCHFVVIPRYFGNGF
jgi:hypothetical protein